MNVITFDGLKHTGTLVSADDLGIELDREIARKGERTKADHARVGASAV